jgi:hypothetical protein
MSSSSHTHQYDPFAPQGTSDQGDNQGNGIPEAFEDEGADLLGMDAPSPSESGPFSLDLLMGTAKTDITYEGKNENENDDDRETETTTNDDSPTKATSQENNTDNFVDDGDEDEKGGGFFSRIRNKIPKGLNTAAAAAASSNINTENTNTDDSPAAKQANGGLEDGGNSLPHPETLMVGSSRDFLVESDSDSDDESEDSLDENGNSLPHPDEVLRTPGIAKTNATNKDEITEAANRMLDENGNSLPHPETLMRGNRMQRDDSDNEPLNDTITPFLNNNDNDSHSSMDNERLMAALDAASGSSDSEDDYYVNDDDDDDESNTDARGKALDKNGNSLSHPETMFPNGSGHGNGNSSNRWGSFRMSLKSSFSKNNDVSKERRENENDGFSDEEVDFTESPSQSNNNNNNNADSFFDLNDNGNSLPNPETVFEEDQPRRKSVLQSIQEGVKSALRGKSSLHSNTPTPENDEETAYGLDDPYTIEVNVDSDDDTFDDESNRGTSQSKKERLQNVLRQHRDNPRSRKIFLLLVVIFILFLAIIIPLSTRNKAKNIGNDPTTLPPTFNLGSCDDEIVLTDMDGRDLKADADEADPAAASCYTTEEPIFFRFKRCRPASPLDWVGVYPEGSMFLDRLWKKHYDGVYLCGGQPCPIEDPINLKGGTPRAKTTRAPPITTPGEYRFFLVKDSDWPYEYLKHTPSFQVVKDKKSCQSSTNNNATASPPPALDEVPQDVLVNVDLGTASPTYVPTWAPTTSAPTSFNQNTMGT